MLVLAGNAPVTVTGLDEGGAAEASGLVVGDVFLGLNGEAVYFLPQREVVARIKQCGFQPISLHVKTVSVLLGVGQGRGIEPVRNCRLGRGGGEQFTRCFLIGFFLSGCVFFGCLDFKG